VIHENPLIFMSLFETMPCYKPFPSIEDNRPEM
jgi:hypothetical protein